MTDGDRIKYRDENGDLKNAPLGGASYGAYRKLVEGRDESRRRYGEYQASWGGRLCCVCDRSYGHDGPHGLYVAATDEEIWAWLRPTEILVRSRFNNLDRLRERFQLNLGPLAEHDLCPCKKGVKMRTPSGAYYCSRRHEDGCCGWESSAK